MAPSQTAGADPAQALTEPDPGLGQGGLAPVRAWLRRKGQNPGPWSEAQQRWAGTLLCCVIALAASFVAGLHSGPQLLYALLFGISLHFLCGETKARAGIEFCSGTVLRFGVALLGARITVHQFAALGWVTAAVVVAAVLSTIACGVLAARRLGLGTAPGVLSGGATAICGASAALALSAVLPRSREQDRFTLAVVIGVTALSTVAMLAYPLIARGLVLPPGLAGLFLGGTIHDVAQVVGAGYMLGSATGDQATIVKLLRVSMLALVVMVVAMSSIGHRHAARSANSTRPPLLPGFLQCFVAMVALNSLGWIPPAWQGTINEVSRACLVVAIAALGVKTSFGTVAEVGWRSLALLLIETLWLTAFVLVAVIAMKIWPLPRLLS